MKPVEPKVYRATTDAWLGQFLLPLVFFSLLTVTAVNWSGMHPWIGGLGLAGLATLAFVDALLPILRNYIKVDHRSIEGSLNGRAFYLYWTEIVAAWTFERKHRRYLCLGSREHTVVLPLRFLDGEAVWQAVRGSVSPSALTEEAMRRLPDYQSWEVARAQALESAMPSTITDHWMVQVLGWAGMPFFLFALMGEAGSGSLFGVALFALLGLGCMILLAGWGLTEINENTVERNTLFGSWGIAWDEVQAIEMDPLDMVMVLVGTRRQLVIPGPALWSGANKKQAMAMLLAQAEKRGIPLRRSPRAALRASRRTRLGRSRARK